MLKGVIFGEKIEIFCKNDNNPWPRSFESHFQSIASIIQHFVWGKCSSRVKR